MCIGGSINLSHFTDLVIIRVYAESKKFCMHVWDKLVDIWKVMCSVLHNSTDCVLHLNILQLPLDIHRQGFEWCMSSLHILAIECQYHIHSGHATAGEFMKLWKLIHTGVTYSKSNKTLVHMETILLTFKVIFPSNCFSSTFCNSNEIKSINV